MLNVYETYLSGYVRDGGMPLYAVMASDSHNKRGIWLGRPKYSDRKNKTYDHLHDDVLFLTNDLNLFDYFVEPESIGQASKYIQDKFRKIEEKIFDKGIQRSKIAPEKEQTWLRFHEKFVKEGIKRKDGKTFNTVILPTGTTINGVDVGGYQFSPLYIHVDNYNANYKAIPLLTDKEVQLRKQQRDENKNFIRDAEGKSVYDVVTVMPEQIKDALSENYRRFREAAKEKSETEKECHTNKFHIEPEKAYSDIAEQQPEEELER